MKIAYDHQAFCMQSYGGISRYHVRLAEELARRGEDIGVFAPLHRNRYLPSLSASLVHGRGVRRYRFPGSRFMQRYNAVLARRRIAGWEPDLVHETYYSAEATAPRGCPTILTVHDMTHELFADQFRPDNPTSELKRQAVARADHVICVSESTRSDLIRLFGTAENKTTVVHLGIEPLPLGEDSEPSLLNSEKPYILFVGQRGRYKNFKGVLQAVSDSNSLSRDFNIVAFGGSSLRQREKQEILQLGFRADQVVHISGSDSILANLYSHAEILVYPSLYEGFGLPPLEAMSVGCPVVSSRISSMPEVLGDAAEYFESGSVEGLRHALESVLYSSARSAELRTLGRARAARYSWEACASATQAVYQQFVSNSA